MPYYVYRLFEDPVRRIEPLGEFEHYPEASRFAKARRGAIAADSVVRVVFAGNVLQAEDALLNPLPAPPRIGDDY